MGCGASTAKGPEQRVVKSCEAEINVEDARTLLADAGVRAHDAGGKTALHHASFHGDAADVEALIQVILPYLSP